MKFIVKVEATKRKAAQYLIDSENPGLTASWVAEIEKAVAFDSIVAENAAYKLRSFGAVVTLIPV